MKLSISKSEASLLLDSDYSKTIESKPLSGFRTAYLDYVGSHKFCGDYIVSVDENPIGLFDSKESALDEFNQLN